MNVTDEPDETGYNWVAPPKASDSVVKTPVELVYVGIATMVLLLCYCKGLIRYIPV